MTAMGAKANILVTARHEPSPAALVLICREWALPRSAAIRSDTGPCQEPWCDVDRPIHRLADEPTDKPTMRESLLLTRDWLAAMAAVKGGAPRVWIDIGTSWRSLASWDVDRNETLVVVGVDALRSNVNDVLQAKSPRFLRIEGACAVRGDANVTFFKHASPTCGSLFTTTSGGPQLGVGADACTGDVPQRLTVRSFRLAALLRRLRTLGVLRIEFLKLDIQGSELECLQSATPNLDIVDNILLEVQDVPSSSPLQLYEGAPTLKDVDSFLGRQGFVRQYCEWNRWGKNVREMNCFFERVSRAHVYMWATGNSRRGQSMVSYDRKRPRHVELVLDRSNRAYA